MGKWAIRIGLIFLSGKDELGSSEFVPSLLQVIDCSEKCHLILGEEDQHLSIFPKTLQVKCCCKEQNKQQVKTQNAVSSY